VPFSAMREVTPEEAHFLICRVMNLLLGRNKSFSEGFAWEENSWINNNIMGGLASTLD